MDVEPGMKMRLLIVLLIAASVIAACSLDRESVPIEEYVVAGTVTAGPTCPVANRARDEFCSDRPVGGALLWVRDEAGAVYSELTTDSDGRFRVNLPAGSYTIEPQPVDGLLGTAQPQDFTAGPSTTVDLAIVYDTGIR